MLEKVRHTGRNKMRNVVVVVLFSAITLVFIFWGLMPRSPGVASGGSAANVNGRMITIAQFESSVQNLTHMYERILGSKADSGAARRMIAQRALQQLVQLELLRQGAEAQGLTVSNKSVRDQIVALPFLKKNGVFQPEYYKMFLQQMHLTAKEFETNLRRELMYERIKRLFSDAFLPIGPESVKLEYLRNTKVELSYLAIHRFEVRPTTTPSVKDVAAFLASSKNQQKLQNYYAQHSQDFSTPAKAQVEEIGIQFNSKDPNVIKKAYALSRQLRVRADKEKFAAITKSLKPDKQMKVKYQKQALTDGQTQDALNAAVFQLQPGQISEPVQTPQGFYIVKMLKLKAAVVTPLKKVQRDVARDLIRQQNADKDIAQLENYVKSGQQSQVENWAKQHHIKWGDTGEFSLMASEVPSLGSESQFMEAAFELTKNDPMAKQVVHVRNSLYVLKLKQRIEPKPGVALSSDKEHSLADQLGDEALGNWLETLQKQASIQENPQVLKQQ